MPLKNIPVAPPSHAAHSDPRIPDVPSIRLISAKPSAAGLSRSSPSHGIFDESIMSSPSSPTPWDSIPHPPRPTAAPLKKKPSRLLPKTSSTALNEASSSGATRLVPKKSKRRLLGSLGNAFPNSNKENARGKDFSDVIRRVASGDMSQQSLAGSAKLRGGFDIYVDPSADPEMGDILVVKKQKSRAALNSMGWGPAGANASRDALGEVTNRDDSNEVKEKKVEVKEGSGRLSKVKADEERKWWSIGRGRKDLKDEKKEKENGEATIPPRRSQTPDPFMGTSGETEQSRGRFNSLDAGILLGFGKKKSNNVLSSEVPTAVAEPPSTAPSPPPTMRRKSYGNIISNSQLHPQTQRRRMERNPTPPQMTYSRSATPTLSGLFSVGPQNDAPADDNPPNQGSIALRAMRSVRSFARIGRASGKGEEVNKAEKEKAVKDKKERKRSKDFGEERLSKRSTLRKEKDDTVRRMSGSSFEAGNLSSGPAQEQNATLHKKRSVLGIGLPSSMKLPRLRSGSTASSIFVSPTPPPPVPPIPSQFATVNSAVLVISSGAAQDDTGTITNGRRSVDSDVTLDGVRRTSVQSTSSSLRPLSVISTVSGTSTGSRTSSGRGSNGASVRWDEAGLQRAKVEREKDFLGKHCSIKAGRRPTTKDTRSGTEPRKRMAISDIFPELAATAPVATKSPSPEPEAKKFPILTIEEATADGHGDVLNMPLVEESDEERSAGEGTDVVATPTRRARARPLSEQLAGKPRPTAFHTDEDGVLTILSAATNDLAQLINHLDLEATPRTPDMTPLKRSSTFSGQTSSTVSPSIDYNGSPLKTKTSNVCPDVKGPGLLPSMASISSLRPYGSSRTVNAGHPTVRQKASFADMMLGKAIPSWPLPENASLASLRAKLKPVASSKAESTAPTRPLEKNVQPSISKGRTHKRTRTPPTSIPNSLPAPSSKRSVKVVKAKVTPERVKDTFDDSSEDEARYRTLRAKAAAKRPAESVFGSTTTAYKSSATSKASGGSKMSSSSSSSRAQTLVEERGVPMSRGAKRMLGMSGTMGGSTVSAYHAELNYNDPDSDVPEELRHILRDNGDAISYQSVNSRNDQDDEEYRDYSAFTSGLRRFGDDDEMTDTGSTYSASPFNPSAMLRSSTSFASMQRSVAGAEIHHAQRLPVYRAQLVTEGAAQGGDFDDDSSVPSDDDTTKKSFDFTGELAKLVQDAEFDSKSFVEEVEKAFNGPARVELNPKYGMTLDVPPVPAIPDFVLKSFNSSSTLSSRNRGASRSFESQESVAVERDTGSMESQSMEMQTPSFLSESRSAESLSLRSWGSGSALDVHQCLDMPSRSASCASTIGTRKSKASISSSASQVSDRHEGELNLSFKFGGIRSASPRPPKVFVPPVDDNQSDDPSEAHRQPLTLSDVIPPPSRVRELSISSSMFAEDFALKSFTANLAAAPQGSSSETSRDRLSQHERTSSGASMASTNSTSFIPLTRPSSGVSFAGMDSYDQLRRGFEFHDQRPNWYPSPAVQTTAARHRARRRARDSVLSTTSVSSYGRVIRGGAPDPFNYGSVPPQRPMSVHFAQPLPSMPSLQEWRQEEDTSRYSMYSDTSEASLQVEDTFSFLHRRPAPRRRVDSDASSFYLKASAPTTRGNRRLSAASGFGMPPVSIYNKSFGHHRRPSSVTSASSIALSYAHGGIGGRAILARHRREASADSTRQFARPGLGEKMFETAASLPAIASPSDSICGGLMSREYGNNRFSTASSDYNDSIFDEGHAYRFNPKRDSIAEEYEDDELPSSRSDSLFEKSQSRSSASSGSLFGNDDSRYHYDESLPQPFRPISSMSITEVHSPIKEDDTMLSLVGGGGRVRKRSVVSMIAASPCIRIDRKDSHRRAALAALQGDKKSDGMANDSTSRSAQNNAPEVQPSIVPPTPTPTGDSPLNSPQRGLFQRKAMEETVLVATGEDNSVPVRTFPVFSRPPPVSRARSSACTTASESSGRDTPPLSPDGSSMYGGSFSSIDMAELSASLSNASQPSSTLASARVRARDNGHSHRRRYSRPHTYRSSVYETIDEEDMSSSSPTPPLSVHESSAKTLQTGAEDTTAVYVVGSDTESVYDLENGGMWDNERGIVALRKFYHLKDEAQSTVHESQMTWLDTPASVLAVQTFDPPRQPEGMKAMLEHSINTYGPLPAELRRIRARKDSRPSPYPSTRFFQTAVAPPTPVCFTSEPAETPVPTSIATDTTFETRTTAGSKPILKAKKLNTQAAARGASKSASPFVVMKDSKADDPTHRPVMGTKPVFSKPKAPLVAKRTAFGAKSTDKKENAPKEGSIMTTSSETLRLNRPRPRGRNPPSQARPIRV